MAVVSVRLRRHIASWQRLAAMVAVLAVACASVGGIAHRAIVQHVACEHGELVELTASSGQETQPLTSSICSDSAHDHHHCALDGFHVPDIQRTIVSEHAHLQVVRVATLLTSARDYRPLAYAPKTSPPV